MGGLEYLLTVMVTLFVIMDPPGIVPIYLALTGTMDRRERNRAALQATLLSLGVISLFALLGQQIINYLHIDLEALQGAGGLLLLLVSLQLLTGKADEPSDAATSNIALVPLGTPLLAGPGAIVAVILFVQQAPSSMDYMWIAIAIVVIHLAIYLVMRFSGFLVKVLRRGGIEVLTRIAGVLLAAIAVQLIADAVMGYVLLFESSAGAIAWGSL
ncbi:MarC family protein [Glycomyces sp. TRM65418]|uniref:MarC family protein n=1 Tax=Glycomyces sp. TRM65418 TaxID=2867006 RepID=UPI001D160B84|nr:MarC family protein [Glycomyces sp. TRM65418]MCC3762829.1 MarC family protein [Glycomyces sp. TRM65418]